MAARMEGCGGGRGAGESAEQPFQPRQPTRHVERRGAAQEGASPHCAAPQALRERGSARRGELAERGEGGRKRSISSTATHLTREIDSWIEYVTDKRRQKPHATVRYPRW